MRPLIAFFFLLFSLNAFAQIGESITEGEAQRILSFLSSDSLKGRENYSAELQKAAYFIATEFRKDSLLYFFDNGSYFQPFVAKNLSKKDKQDILSGRYDSRKVLLNVIGVLDGKSKPEEVVIFSAHYDHIGTNGRKKGDTIFNGANDDASGVTAVLSLAHYFAQQKENERTLIFCAFAGEELGLLGSQAFAQILKPQNVVAVINIEMIGRSGAVGKNAFFITGSGCSDLTSILQKNLEGQEVTIQDEPNPPMQLFQRSDNYSFALKGIPAHTIMCSDDTDDCYHHECDEADRIDVRNMTKVIKAIAAATTTLVDGTATPTRITGIKPIEQ